MGIPFEDMAYCYDCGDVMGLANPFPAMFSQYQAHNKGGYCATCKKAAEADGYIFRGGVKTSPAIEQMCDEATLIWTNSLKNKYF